MKIVKADYSDKEEVLQLYKAMIGGPAGWDETYPSKETIAYDLERDSLFVMKNEKQEIVATISIDEDENVEKLSCWSNELYPGGELSRLCVREDMRNQGVARLMMKHAFDVLRQRGKKSVHILVMKNHVVALASYSKLGYEVVGECHMYDHDYLCMELSLL